MNKRNRLWIVLLCIMGGIFTACSNNPSLKETKSCVDSLNVCVNADSIEAKSSYTRRTEMDKILVYTPLFKSIDLICGTMPSVSDTNVIFCAEAAFTGQLLNSFKHTNIAGDHVSGGVRYKGYACERNTGAFVFYDGQYRFLYDNYSSALNLAQDAGGMGFGQEMLIFEGRKVPCMRKDSNINEFRALCELDNCLCVVDSKGKIPFGEFVSELIAIGVKNALYLDMGKGWNYSWWRDENKSLNMIHDEKIRYTTNWITFYGK